MAAGCVTRVWALAIATVACVGLPSALVYAMVRIAAARRYGATFALGLVLVFWVTVSAAYYPRVCGDLVDVPWLSFLRRARARLSRGRGGEPVVLVTQLSYIDVLPRLRRQAQAPAPAPAGSGGARLRDDAYPGPFEHQRVPLAQRYGDRGGGMMGAHNGGEPSRQVPQRPSFATVDAFPPRPRPQAPPPAPAAPARGGGARARAGDVVSAPEPYPFEHQRMPMAQRYGPYGERRVVMMPVFPWETPTVIDVPPPLPPRYPLYEQQQRVPQSHGDHASTSRMAMAALPREPPAARGKSSAGARDDDNGVPRRPPCEEQGDGEPSKYCVICMANVDKETAKWLPLCLHVFHRQCIDQWLQGHSTCPVCRCNDAFRTAECVLTTGEGRVF